MPRRMSARSYRYWKKILTEVEGTDIGAHIGVLQSLEDGNFTVRGVTKSTGIPPRTVKALLKFYSYKGSQIPREVVEIEGTYWLTPAGCDRLERMKGELLRLGEPLGTSLESP